MFKQLSQNVIGEISQVFERMDDSAIRPLMELIKTAPRIFLLGAGREGLSTKTFAMRLTHLGKTAYWIWDDTTPAIGKGDVLICTSGSADIGHINHVAEKAKQAGAAIALVTASRSGFLTGLSDVTAYLPAEAYNAKGDFVKSGQLMGNLFEQCLFILFDIIVMMLREEMSVSREEMVARHRNVE